MSGARPNEKMKANLPTLGSIHPSTAMSRGRRRERRYDRFEVTGSINARLGAWSSQNKEWVGVAGRPEAAIVLQRFAKEVVTLGGEMNS
jgi:hypothetical protein